MAKKKTAKKAAAKKAAPKKKSVSSKKAVKAAPKSAQKTAQKTTQKPAAKKAQAGSSKAKATKAPVAAKGAGSSEIEAINLALQAAVEMTMELGDMEAGVNGVTENDIEDAVTRLAAVRKKAWDLLMGTFPDLIDRLMFTEMIECAYEDEKAGAIRFAGSAVGWDEVGSQFVILGRRGDVWEGEGKILETVLATEVLQEM